MAKLSKKKSSATARKKSAVSKKNASKPAKDSGGAKKKSAKAAEKAVLTVKANEKATKKKTSSKVTAKKSSSKKSAASKKATASKATAASSAPAKASKKVSATANTETAATAKAAAKRVTRKKAKASAGAAEKGAASKKAGKKSVTANNAATHAVSKIPVSNVDAEAENDDEFESDLPISSSGPSVVRYERNGHYMDPEQLKHFSNKLADWKQQLMEEVDRTVGHMKDDATNFPDPNDRATQEEEFSLELRTRDRERKLIKKINEAQKRIDDDEYGYCETCGIEIGVSRLEARPTAELCIDCKTLEEIRERQTA